MPGGACGVDAGAHAPWSGAASLSTSPACGAWAPRMHSSEALATSQEAGASVPASPGLRLSPGTTLQAPDKPGAQPGTRSTFLNPVSLTSVAPGVAVGSWRQCARNACGNHQPSEMPSFNQKQILWIPTAAAAAAGCSESLPDTRSPLLLWDLGSVPALPGKRPCRPPGHRHTLPKHQGLRHGPTRVQSQGVPLPPDDPRLTGTPWEHAA